jgi:hypothetical protein
MDLYGTARQQAAPVLASHPLAAVMPKYVSINGNVIRSMLGMAPALHTRSRTGSNPTYASELEILGSARLLYDPEKAILRCGARLCTSSPSQVPAAGAGEPRLDVRQLHLIGPSICTEGDGVAAVVGRAVHEQPTRTALAHLGEGDFLRAGEFASAGPGKLTIGHVFVLRTATNEEAPAFQPGPLPPRAYIRPSGSFRLS